MKLNLNTDAPEQHMAILVIAGVLTFLSLLSSFKSSAVDNGIQQVDPSAQSGPLYANPHLTWYERAFCRGFQRASFCSYRFIHPMNPVIEEMGYEMEAAPAKAPGAIDYRGELPSNRAVSGRITLDERF